jgi:hypothetical protein
MILSFVQHPWRKEQCTIHKSRIRNLGEKLNPCHMQGPAATFEWLLYAGIQLKFDKYYHHWQEKCITQTLQD